MFSFRLVVAILGSIVAAACSSSTESNPPLAAGGAAGHGGTGGSGGDGGFGAAGSGGAGGINAAGARGGGTGACTKDQDCGQNEGCLFEDAACTKGHCAPISMSDCGPGIPVCRCDGTVEQGCPGVVSALG